MSDTLTNDERATRLCTILAEYAEKLRAINGRFLDGWVGNDLAYSRDRAAIVLDQIEMIRAPLEKVVGVASQMIEQGEIDHFAADEMTLRLAELEAEFHHSVRIADSVQKKLAKERRMDDIARLRVATGLNAMKGGPLRPAS